MREIKFRGKRIDNNEWSYGSLIIEPNLPEFSSIYSDVRNFSKSQYLIYPIDAKDGRAIEVIPETVGQLIGLKDNKKGKEIYGGDIVKWLGYEAAFEEGMTRQIRPERIIVVTNEINNWYKVSNIVNYSPTRAEVIGNIYENPELLKGDENGM